MSLHHLISDFGRSVGMEGLVANAQGVVCLGVGESSDLYLESAGDDAVVYIIRPQAFPRESLFREALKLCHPEERYPFPVHAGWRGEDRLGFFIRLPIQDQTLPQLEMAVDQLRQMHQRIERVAS